jgi:hypothetical protein
LPGLKRPVIGRGDIRNFPIISNRISAYLNFITVIFNTGRNSHIFQGAFKGFMSSKMTGLFGIFPGTKFNSLIRIVAGISEYRFVPHPSISWIVVTIAGSVEMIPGYTVPPIIRIPWPPVVVGRSGEPSDPKISPGPNNSGGNPVGSGHPYPTMTFMPYPISVMISVPPPRFTGNPDIPPTRCPDPFSIRIRLPFNYIGLGFPAVTVRGYINPGSILIKNFI